MRQHVAAHWPAVARRSSAFGLGLGLGLCLVLAAPDRAAAAAEPSPHTSAASATPTAPPEAAQSHTPDSETVVVPAEPATFEVGIDVVGLTAVVSDVAGHFVQGLGIGDIEVSEDGVVQDVSYFREARGGAARMPLSVVLVLDTSGSLRHNQPFLQEAASAFVNKLEPGDSILLVDFNEAMRGSVEFSSDVGRLERFLSGLSAGGGTSLYDAVFYALDRVRARSGRKAVIVFSDGADTTSTHVERDVVQFARAVEATIYSVGIRGDRGLFSRAPRGFLKKVADESGGAYYFPKRVDELLRIFSAISEELHNHYALGYTPQRAPDGTWRRIGVRVLKPGVQARVRRGYFALQHQGTPARPGR